MNEKIQRDELAKLAGLTPRRLNQLAQENKIPAPVKGQFPTRETLTALFNYFRNRKEAESITEARLRRQIAQADMAELDLAERREALLPAENIEFWIIDILTKFRTDLMHLAHQVADEWEATPARTTALKSLIDARIRQCLHAAADSMRYVESIGQPVPKIVTRTEEAAKKL